MKAIEKYHQLYPRDKSSDNDIIRNVCPSAIGIRIKNETYHCANGNCNSCWKEEVLEE